VADCTGHGVPGGFMSVVAFNALTNAVNESKNMNAAQILFQLNKMLSETLKQTGRVKDWLDIATCVLNTQTLELQFAGAYCPLYVIKENEFIEVKGDSSTIGTSDVNNYFTFKNHQIKLSLNDAIYIFTDGYADQYGGTENKKFTTDQLRNILSAAQSYSMEQQKELLDKTMQQWLGNNDQADDMLIMGIRIQENNKFSIVAN